MNWELGFVLDCFEVSFLCLSWDILCVCFVYLSGLLVFYTELLMDSSILSYMGRGLNLINVVLRTTLVNWIWMRLGNLVHYYELVAGLTMNVLVFISGYCLVTKSEKPLFKFGI